MMKSFREWLSCHSLSKSLLSASPFSFFYAEPKDGDFGSHAGMARVAVISSQTTHSSENQQNISLANPQPPVAEPTHPDQYNVNQGDKDPLGQVEAFQIKFLRLVHRIGQSPSNPVVSKVLYRLELASLIRAGESNLKRPGLKIDKARAIASALEESKQDDFEFSFRILVLGKTGVGKSALINSLFDEERVATNAFQPATGCIQLVAGTVKGIKVTVIDTPGLLPSNNNQLRNRRILSDIKKFIRKSPPDAILYVERLDVLNRGYNDFPLLKLITDVFGSSIWFNTILVMTHCSSPLPEGPDGYPINYEAFVSRCADLLQYGIQQMVPTMQLVCPLLLVESHHMCMKNSKGEKVLPNGQAWVSQFLLLCTATKVLCDANSLLKFQDSLQSIRSSGKRLPSLPHLLSSLLQRHSPSTAGGVYDIELEELSDSEEDEYDQLPPIRILTKTQYQKLSRLQKKAYLDELDYRETLYLKKQWRAEVRRKKKSTLPRNASSQNIDDENSVSNEVVQLPDTAIPLSFSSDCPSHRYRCLLGNDDCLVRPVLDSHGWDHDAGFDGLSLEVSKQIKGGLTASAAGQTSKDKENFFIQSECAVNFAHQKGHLFSALDFQTAGKDLVCTLRGDAYFRNLRCNSTGCSLSLTSLGKIHLFGAKLEDSILLGRRFELMGNAGRIEGNGQGGFGGSLQATLRGKDYPVRDEKVTLSSTLLSFDKEMVVGGGLQADFRAGRTAKISFNANVNSRSLGQVSFKFTATEQIELGIIAIVSLLQALIHRTNCHGGRSLACAEKL